MNPSTSEHPTQSAGSGNRLQTPETGASQDPSSLIRPLGPGDLAAVVAIERRSFGSPWSPAMFHSELARDGVIALAAESERRIVGYSVTSMLGGAWHLMNVAVDPAHRRLGIASRLVRSSLRIAGPDLPVTLEVRPSNREAIGLYRRLGFEEAGYRRGYYPDDGEDALVMWLGDPARAGVPREVL